MEAFTAGKTPLSTGFRQRASLTFLQASLVEVESMMCGRAARVTRYEESAAD